MISNHDAIGTLDSGLLQIKRKMEGRNILAIEFDILLY